MKLVLRHNQEASAGKHSFTLGMNHLADMVGLFSNISLSLLLRETETCGAHRPILHLHLEYQSL